MKTFMATLSFLAFAGSVLMSIVFGFLAGIYTVLVAIYFAQIAKAD